MIYVSDIVRNFDDIYVAVFLYRGIVQLVERWSPKPNVEGSSPSAPVNDDPELEIQLWIFFRSKTFDIIHVMMRNLSISFMKLS